MTLQFTVPDMCCNGCVRSITKVLQAMDADVKIDTDLQVKALSVDTKVAKEEIVAALEKAGFPPQ